MCIISMHWLTYISTFDCGNGCIIELSYVSYEILLYVLLLGVLISKSKFYIQDSNTFTNYDISFEIYKSILNNCFISGLCDTLLL